MHNMKNEVLTNNRSGGVIKKLLLSLLACMILSCGTNDPTGSSTTDDKDLSDLDHSLPSNPDSCFQLEAYPSLDTLLRRPNEICLQLLDINPITDFSPLLSMHKLISLELEEYELENVDPIGEITWLRHLHLWHCWNLTDIGALGRIENLQSLYIDGCPLLRDLSPIGSITTLKQLYFETSDSTIVDCTQLKNLRLKKLDMTSAQVIDHHELVQILDSGSLFWADENLPDSVRTRLQQKKVMVVSGFRPVCDPWYSEAWPVCGGEVDPRTISEPEPAPVFVGSWLDTLKAPVALVPDMLVLVNIWHDASYDIKLEYVTGVDVYMEWGTWRERVDSILLESNIYASMDTLTGELETNSGDECDHTNAFALLFKDGGKSWPIPIANLEPTAKAAGITGLAWDLFKNDTLILVKQ